MTAIVNISKDPYDIYIGRGSKWGNPYYIGIDGTRQQVIKKYEEYIRNNKELMLSIPELIDKILGCHCSPKPCHGDVLIKLVNEYKIYTFFGD